MLYEKAKKDLRTAIENLTGDEYREELASTNIALAAEVLLGSEHVTQMKFMRGFGATTTALALAQEHPNVCVVVENNTLEESFSRRWKRVLSAQRLHGKFLPQGSVLIYDNCEPDAAALPIGVKRVVHVVGVDNVFGR